jgi:hypothetical protein
VQVVWWTSDRGDLRRHGLEGHLSARAHALQLISAAYLEHGTRDAAAVKSAAAALTKRLIGGCTISVWRGTCVQAQVAAEHPDPTTRRVLQRLARHAPGCGGDAFSSKLRESNELIVFPTVSPAMLRLWTAPGFAPFLEHQEITSLVVAPLRVSVGVAGALSVWREGAPWPFNSHELTFVESAARLLAHALMATHHGSSGAPLIRHGSVPGGVL